MTEKRFQWVYIKDNTLELRDNGIVKVFNNERLEELLNDLSEENEKLKIFLKAVSVELDLANRDNDILEEENEELKQYKQSVNDVLKSWSQKNLTAKQLQVVLAIMEELNVMGDVE